MIRFIPFFLMFMLPLLGGCGAEGNDNNATVDTSLLLTPEHGEAGSAWGLSTCEDCHVLSAIHQRTTEKTRTLVTEKGHASCGGCHGDNGAGVPRPCTLCHNAADLPGQPALEGLDSHNFQALTPGALNDGHCPVCHAGSDMNGVWNRQVDLTRFVAGNGVAGSYGSASDFCLRCHNADHPIDGFTLADGDPEHPLAAMETYYQHIDYHGWQDGTGARTYSGLRPGYRYGSRVACTDCHAMHGTNNSFLLLDRSDKGAKRLTDSDTVRSVTIADGDYSQLCVLCHRMTTILESGGVDTGNGLSGVHETGSDCRPCHSHGQAVQVGL